MNCDYRPHHELTRRKDAFSNLDLAFISAFRTPPRFALTTTTLTPYLDAMRVDKPVGTLIAYAPYVLGCLFAASVPDTNISPGTLQNLCLEMLPAVAIFRALGCVWNDVADRDFDVDTERCRNRPVARADLSVLAAYHLCFGLLSVGLILVMLGCESAVAALYFLPIPFLIACYPYAKRFTDYPQLLLGVTFSQGVLFGSAQAGLPLHRLLAHQHGHATVWGLVLLFVAYTVWTLIYDTVYAFQDVQDDIRTGVGSMAVHFRGSSTSLLVSLSVLQIVVLWMIGRCMTLSSLYYWLACGGIGCLLLCMVCRLDVKNPAQCQWWFNYGTVLFTILLSLGLGYECRS